MGIRYCTDEKISPVFSWQDCPDTGKSTSAYKIFSQGSFVAAKVTVPIALSSTEAEYMSCCNLGATLYHLRELFYELQFFGEKDYDINGFHSKIPTTKQL